MPESLQQLLEPSRISTRWVDRLTHSRDASLYRLVPQAVVRPRTVHEVQRLLRWCSENGRHLTFRAGGTSLSGQAVTDDLLVDLSSGWDQVNIGTDGHRITLGPGITGGHANGMLRRYARKLGPDPASMAAAMVGGIVANNASGMCCGTAQNTYHTMESMDVLLSDGTRVDSSLADADERLKVQAPHIHAGLLSLRDRVRASGTLSSRIRSKYRIKNTMGYSLNAFLDEDLPARILARLMVGSEGTLGFIISVTFRTVPDPLHKWTSLTPHSSIEAASDAALFWRDRGAAAVELMDDASIRSFASLDSTPAAYRFPSAAAALLVEFHDLEPPPDGLHWSTTAAEQAAMWRLRKGLMPTIGAQRLPGQTMINEDVAVLPERLPMLVRDVKGAFQSHGYEEAIIFGHAKDGNIHFVVNQSFASDVELNRYAAFMEEIAEIVVGRHDGSLKAEHGTGRNMAPFLEQEWGAEAVTIMREIKELLDPHGVLNPGVILNSDARVHLQNIKPVPVVDAEVDACIECGFCEHVCPTRSATLTPRQRIVLRRELQLVQDADLKAELERSESYFSIQSCAVDGICATACPVGINTGAFVKRVRTEREPGIFNWFSATAAKHYGPVSAFTGLLARSAIPTRLKLLQAPDKHAVPAPTNRQIFLPSCPGRWYQPDLSLVHELAALAGIALVLPDGHESLCCGQPFESQGHDRAHETITRASISALETLQEDHRDVLTDTSTCVAAYQSYLKERGWRVRSVATWLRDDVLPRVRLEPLIISVAVHPGCGDARVGESGVFFEVARTLAPGAEIPATSHCCGMAGMHGVRYPEVPRTALAPMRDELRNAGKRVVVTGNELCARAIERGTEVPAITLLQLAGIATGLLQAPTLEKPGSSR